MLITGSSLTLCQKNVFILHYDNTNHPVTDLNYGEEIGFTDSLVSTSVLSTEVAILELCHSQYY